MYNYNLKFKAGMNPDDAPLTVLDSKRKELFFRNKISEAMRKGKTPCEIFAHKEDKQPIYTTLRQEKDGLGSYAIKKMGGESLGKLIAETEHSWKVLDEHDKLLATIQEKMHWKKESCLYEIITFPFSISTRDTFLKMLAPHRFTVYMQGKKVLELREEVEVITDNYILRKSAELSEQQEILLVICLMTTL